jgi:hypothetical protein
MTTRANIVIDQGAAFSAEISVTDDNSDVVDLSGYTANAQMKKWYTSTNSVSFSTSINAEEGLVTISLTTAQTANIEFGRYVYDVIIHDTNSVSTKIVEGIAMVTPTVTI